MYDEEAYQYQTPPRSPIPVAIITSIITTAVVFFALRMLEDRGLLPHGARGGDGAVEVPSLLGLRPDQARELLRGRDMLLNLAAEHEDSKYPPGTIASQTPLPGSQASRGTSVQAVISRGVAQVQVPNLVGLRPEDAARQIATAGLQVGPQKTVASATVAAGMVAQTEPAAGSPLSPQGVVTLVVSSGGASKTVPRVTGMRLSRARKVLEDAGFTVGKVHYDSDDDRMGGVILRQQPAENTAAAPGTPVDITVNED